MSYIYCIEVPAVLRKNYSSDYLYFETKRQSKECSNFFSRALKSMGFDPIEENDWERNYQETREEEYNEENENA